MTISARTEKAIKKAMALKSEAIGTIKIRANGNHTIIIQDQERNVVMTTTFRQILGKRLKKRGVKK